MTAKQLAGTAAPDGSTYITVTDGAGNLLSPITQSSVGAGVSTALASSVNTSGGVATVAVGATSWTPVDASGAGLTFTSVNAQYTQIGNLVTAYGTLTYPTTTSASNATITLPTLVPNQPYAAVFGTTVNTSFIKAVPNTTTATIGANTGVPATNSALSARVITFMISYPAS
jgi:hypothetical protein